jgi:hypothetical protein
MPNTTVGGGGFRGRLIEAVKAYERLPKMNPEKQK